MPFTPWTLGRRLRASLQRFSRHLGPDRHLYPEISAALSELERAVDLDLPPWLPNKRKAPGRPKTDRAGQSREMPNKVTYLRRVVRQLRARVQSLLVARRRDALGRTSATFMAKVALSKPVTSVRGFADSFQDLVGTGLCSRTTITRIRSAFVPVIQQMTQVRLRSLLALSLKLSAQSAGLKLSAQSAGQPWSTVLLHIHDEASLRLRSSATAAGAPERSRRSKVQQHLLWLHLPGQKKLFLPAELHALSDKSAPVLATSLHKTLVGVVSSLQESLVVVAGSEAAQIAWFVHLLVGDGCATNSKSARLLWEWLKSQPLPRAFRYFLVVVKCSSHQANLSVSCAVTGRAALAGCQNTTARSAGEDIWVERKAASSKDTTSPHRTVCGVIVRLYKYLVNDYYSEFYSALGRVVGRLRFVQEPPVSEDVNCLKWHRLAQLYGTGVFPKGLLDLLNRGLDIWEHRLHSAQSAGEEVEQSIREKLLELLRRRLLVVDESPTLTRMFTFVGHVHGLLLLWFLGLARDVLRCQNVTPREKNKHRLTNVLGFLGRGDTSQYLRRTALALQLPAHVNGICGQQRSAGDPLLVRLYKGEVTSVVSRDLARLLGSLHLDADLDCSACVTVLLGVAVDLVVRFQSYSRYPYAACQLCGAFNREFRVACLDFLRVPEAELDPGFSLQLRLLARSAGDTEVERIAYLLSEPVQSTLRDAFMTSAASSLPVERAFAQTKRKEAPRLCHLATASMHQIIRGFLREREEIASQVQQAEVALQRALRTNLQSLAWERRRALVGRPLGAIARSASSSSYFVKAHASADLKSYIDSNRLSLERELRERRAACKSRVASAKAGNVPVTDSEWHSWFITNHTSFWESMKTVVSERRALSERVRESVNVPESAPKWPSVDSSTAQSAGYVAPEWVKTLRGRDGWFAVQCGGRPVKVLYVLSSGRYRSHAVDLQTWREGRTYVIQAGKGGLALGDLVRPLEDIEIIGDYVRCLELVVSAQSAEERVTLSFSHARPLAGPLPRAERASKRSLEELPPDTESDVSEVAAAVAADVKVALSDSSECVSVDTDLDEQQGDFVKLAPDAKLPDSEGSEVETSEAEEAADAAAQSAEDDVAQSGEDDAVAAQSAGRLGGIPGRAVAGTWIVWENPWFYINYKPGMLDIKIHMKAPYRTPPGYGMWMSKMWSKTLTPHHFNETVLDPTSTMLLLRSWSVWRSRWAGWVAARECRQRESAQQEEKLIEEVAAQSAGAAHLLRHADAERWLLMWTPSVARAVRQRLGWSD